MREESRKEWNGGGTLESINAGSLQRIADATELMAKDYRALIAERDQANSRAAMYEAWYRKESNRVRALRGVITRLKRRMAR